MNRYTFFAEALQEDIAFSSWEDGMQSFIRDNDTWEEIDELQSVSFVARKLPQPLQQLIQTIPVEIMQLAYRFSYGQYRVLAVAARHTYAYQLLCNNPNLYWLWVHSLAKEQLVDPDNWQQMLQIPQGELLLQIVGNDAAAWVVQNPKLATSLLRYIRIATGDKQEYTRLIQILCTDGAKPAVSFLCRTGKKVLPLEFVELLTASELLPVKIVTDFFVQHVQPVPEPPEPSDPAHWKGIMLFQQKQFELAGKRYTQLQGIVADIDRMGEQIAETNMQTRLKKLQTMQELQDFHDELVKKINASKIPEIELLVFPEHPHPGTEHIIPITNSRELHKEGVEMRHCVYAAYTTFIYASGMYFAYKITSPERATLMLKKKYSEQKYDIHDFRLAYNREPGSSTVDMVNTWLAEWNSVA